MRYAIATFGCRVNQADSLQLEMRLRAGGGVRAPLDEADLVVVNTCSVTATADHGARQTLRRVARLNPDARVVATGCYATRAGDEIAALPGSPDVVPNDEKDTLVDRLLPLLPSPRDAETTAERFGDGAGACGALVSPGVVGRVAFMLRVQTGCDEPCAYCIIPSTRGRGRSLEVARVLAAVSHAADSGFQEIVLTGVHLGSYGRDFKTDAAPSSLTTLLRALDRHPSDVTFRIQLARADGLSGPRSWTWSWAAAGSRPISICRSRHASDAMLRRMRRPYTLELYRRVVDRIRDRLPHAAIGSDLIAGYPGERAEDAARTREYVSGSPLTYLHVFPYSPRTGTQAARLSDRVTGPLVRDRARALRAVGTELSRQFRAAQVGVVRPGLTLEGGTVVLTDNYLKVGVTPGRAGNERVRVRVTSAEPLAGELVTD